MLRHVAKYLLFALARSISDAADDDKSPWVGDDREQALWIFKSGVLTIRRSTRSPYDVDWTGAKIAFAPAVEETLRI